jgi:hypothetical protein
MKKADQDTTQTLAPRVNANRRRLTKVGLAAPAILGTLASKQVLGAAPWACMASAQASGNLSDIGQANCGSLGAGLSAYRSDGKEWPGQCGNFFETNGTGCKYDKPLDFQKTPANLGTKFVSGFTVPHAGTTKTATVLDVYNSVPGLASSNSNISVEFGREILLALLNAYAKAPHFPLQPIEVVYMFNDIANSGSYQTGGRNWTPAQALGYLRMLHP